MSAPPEYHTLKAEVEKKELQSISKTKKGKNRSIRQMVCGCEVTTIYDSSVGHAQTYLSVPCAAHSKG